MLTRFFNVKIKTGKSREFKEFYDREILPTLQETRGCRYGSLIQSVEDPNDFIAFSLWDSADSIHEWENSETFAQLVDRAREYFAGSNEWRVQLTKDLKLEYTPMVEEPVVRSFQAATHAEPKEISRAATGPMYVRLTSLRVEQEKLSEFKEIYDSLIIPTLSRVEGCRYAFFVQSPKESEVISVTIWDSKEHADVYEQGGTFDRLLDKVRPTLSQIYQWKMKLSEEAHATTVTSEEVDIKGYRVISGRELK
jgi:quinol monooxygenase YgiN